MATELTCAEECSLSAKLFSLFADPGKGAIPSNIICSAMGLAIFRGGTGVALVRLSSDWSAPCAILLQAPGGPVSAGQESVLLFMSEAAIFSLTGRTPMILGQTHSFAPGPMYTGNVSADVLLYVRYNNGFTPGELIQQHMFGWSVQEDVDRHTRWHGDNATWFDVLTNKISVDRSSVGNALYLILNLTASGGKPNGKNYANIEDWAKEMERQQEQELDIKLGLYSKTPHSSPMLAQQQLIYQQDQMQMMNQMQPIMNIQQGNMTTMQPMLNQMQMMNPMQQMVQPNPAYMQQPIMQQNPAMQQQMMQQGYPQQYSVDPRQMFQMQGGYNQQYQQY